MMIIKIICIVVLAFVIVYSFLNLFNQLLEFLLRNDDNMK